MNTISLPNGEQIELDTATLPVIGHVALVYMRAHFPKESERERQVMALAEEAGEFVGAYRRWTGLARRPGGWEDVESELADVLITAHVTAAAFDTTITPMLLLGRHRRFQYASVLEVSERVGQFVAQYLAIPTADDGILDEAETAPLQATLSSVAAAAWAAADALSMDLEAAWRAKAVKVFTRGWRDTTPDGGAADG